MSPGLPSYLRRYTSNTSSSSSSSRHSTAGSCPIPGKGILLFPKDLEELCQHHCGTCGVGFSSQAHLCALNPASSRREAAPKGVPFLWGSHPVCPIIFTPRRITVVLPGTFAVSAYVSYILVAAVSKPCKRLCPAVSSGYAHGDLAVQGLVGFPSL